MEAIWPQAFVEEANLTQSIFLLRKTLSDSASGRRYIVTVLGRGYQLAIAPIELTETVAAAGNSAINIAPKPAGSASEIPETAPWRNRLRRTGLYAVSLIALTGVFFAGWRLWHGHSEATRPYAIRRLSNSGDVQFTAISPSGTYVASVLKSALGSESISVSDLRTGTSRVILEGDAEVFHDVTFSPDDLYLYYRAYSKAAPDRVSSEYRVPLLGGNPMMVIGMSTGR